MLEVLFDIGPRDGKHKTFPVILTGDEITMHDTC
uniref:Uncharacterized protein n=1 Tax=Rhizophora mucronata TaxID=61149 RepID=A0A2P2NBE0_RHIMU